MTILVDGAQDMPERQRTMRRTLEWSYELLMPDEQSALQGLSVFEDGAPVDVAETVCGVSAILCRPPIEALHGLVDKGLIAPVDGSPGGRRVVMLGVVQEFARELLSTSAREDALRRAHADWCLQLVENSQVELFGPSQAEWLNRLDRELGNIRAALRWSARGAPVMGLTISVRLRRFWLTRGHCREGRTWLENLLQCAGEVPTALMAEATTVVADLARWSGDLAGAADGYRDSLRRWRAIDDDAGAAHCLEGLGSVAMEQGDLEHGTHLTNEALGLRRALCDPRGIATTLNNLGAAAYMAEDMDRAHAIFEDALCNWRLCDDRRGIVVALLNLGEIDNHRGAYERAAAVLAESITLATELGDPRLKCIAFRNQADVLYSLRRIPDAVKAYHQSLRLGQGLRSEADIAATAEGIALMCNSPGTFRNTVRLLGAASAIRDRIGCPRTAIERRREADLRFGIQAELGEALAKSEWQAGQRLSVEQTIAEAVRLLGKRMQPDSDLEAQVDE